MKELATVRTQMNHVENTFPARVSADERISVRMIGSLVMMLAEASFRYDQKDSI